MAAALALCALARPAAAMSGAEKDITFWTVAVMPFQGRVGPVTGPRAGARLAIGLRDTRHFRVVPPNRLAAALKKLGIRPDDVMGTISKSDAKAVSDLLGLDGIILGRVSPEGKRVRLDVEMVSSRGQPFGKYQLRVTTNFTRQEAIRSALLLSQKLPYDGLIIRIDDQQALVNVGASQGVKPGAKLYAFKFSKVKTGRNGYTGGERDPIAELEVIRVSRFGAWVRPVKGEMPEQYAKVSTRIIAGEISSGGNDSDSSVGALPWLTIAAGMGLRTKNYVLESDSASYTSDTSFFPMPGFDAELSVLTSGANQIAVGGGFHHGFIPFRRPGATGDNAETFAGALDQGYAELIYRRYFGGTGRFRESHVGLSLGYRLMAFSVEEQQPLVLTSDTYNQVTAGADLAVPVVEWLSTRRRRVFVFAGGGVIPFATISQTPVDNGSASTFGAYANVGAQLHWTRSLVFTLGYGLDFVRSTFQEDGGSRGLLNPISTDRYQGAMLRVDYRLIK